MAIHETEDLGVARRSDGHMVLEARIDGRRRKIVMTAEAAQRVGTVLANGGFDLLAKNPGYPRLEDAVVKLLPEEQLFLAQLGIAQLGGPLAFVADEASLRLFWHEIGDALREAEGGKGPRPVQQPNRS